MDFVESMHYGKRRDLEQVLINHRSSSSKQKKIMNTVADRERSFKRPSIKFMFVNFLLVLTTDEECSSVSKPYIQRFPSPVLLIKSSPSALASLGPACPARACAPAGRHLPLSMGRTRRNRVIETGKGEVMFPLMQVSAQLFVSNSSALNSYQTPALK